MGDDRSHAGSSSIDPCDESYVRWRGLLSVGVVVDAMSEFTVCPRSDCGNEHPERFAIVAPNGCVLRLKPLTLGQANSIVAMLNAFVDESETD